MVLWRKKTLWSCACNLLLMPTERQHWRASKSWHSVGIRSNYERRTKLFFVWNHTLKCSSTHRSRHSMCCAHANEWSQIVLWPNPNPNHKKCDQFVARNSNPDVSPFEHVKRQTEQYSHVLFLLYSAYDVIWHITIFARTNSICNTQQARTKQFTLHYLPSTHAQ